MEAALLARMQRIEGKLDAWAKTLSGLSKKEKNALRRRQYREEKRRREEGLLPLPEQHVEDFGDLPTVIRIYQAALETDFQDQVELERELEITLVHEIAHFMGFDEDQLEELGYG